VAGGYLTGEEADSESRAFSLFAPRMDRLLIEEQGRLNRMIERLEQRIEDLRSFAERAASFFSAGIQRVPVYLFANPSDDRLGGGYNGGRVTLDVPRVVDAMPTLLHELMHVYVDARRATLLHAIQQERGLDYQTLNEGLAYALSPGIIHASCHSDPLAHSLDNRERDGYDFSDALVRFMRTAVQLRPQLQQAWERSDGRLEDVLASLADAWSGVSRN